MKIVILGDVHLGKSIKLGKPGSGKELNSRIQDQVSLLYWVLDKAVENGSRHIFITGDVYEDPRPHPSLIIIFMKWLKAAEKLGVSVYIVVGNHDMFRTGTHTYSALDIVQAIEMQLANSYHNYETVHLDGMSVTLAPYRDRRMYEVETTEEALERLKGELLPQLNSVPKGNTKVIVGHLALEGSILIGDEIDDELNEIFCPASLFKGWDAVWMGHVHNPQVLVENPIVAHIGSMERSDFSREEMKNDKFIVLQDSDGTFERINLPNRAIHRIEILVPNDSDSDDYIKNHLSSLNKNSELKDSIIKLEIKLSQSVNNADRAEVSRFIYEDIGAHYICYFSESRVLDTIVLDSESLIDQSMSPEAAIDAYWGSVTDLSEEEIEKCKALAKSINKMYEDNYGGI